jgi:hypothetical protein
MNEIVKFFLSPNAFTLLYYQHILINASSSIILFAEHDWQIYVFAFQSN